MIFNEKTRVWYMLFGTRSYQIHADLLRGITYADLKNLDPDTNSQHRTVLDILGLTTRLMVGETPSTVVQFPDGKPLDMRSLLQIHTVEPESNNKTSRA